MPLSDHEQQLLDQLEKQLRNEDPGFAQNISRAESTGTVISARHLVTGIIILVLGIAVALASIFFLSMPLSAVGGVLGFAIMVGGGYWALSGGSAADTPAAAKGSAGNKPAKPARRGSFMDNVEKRWEQRRGEQP